MVDALAFALGRYNYWIVIVLMMTGLYIVFSRGNLVKTIIGLNIFQTSVFIFYITLGKVAGGTAPILIEDKSKKDSHGEDHGEGHHAAADAHDEGHDAAHDTQALTPEEAAAVVSGERVNEVGALEAADLPTTPGTGGSLHDAPPQAVNVLGANRVEGTARPPAEPSDDAVIEIVPQPTDLEAAADPHSAEAYGAADAAAEILYSNPLPHVLILTAIVVGVATTAVGLAIAVRIREAYGTVEEDLLEEMDNRAASPPRDQKAAS